MQQVLVQELFDFFVDGGLVTLPPGAVHSRPLGNQQLTGANNDLNGLGEQVFKVGCWHEMGGPQVGWIMRWSSTVGDASPPSAVQEAGSQTGNAASQNLCACPPCHVLRTQWASPSIHACIDCRRRISVHAAERLGGHQDQAPVRVRECRVTFSRGTP
ncbi:hypothetical protein D3C75_891350 [compost metagenome]